MGFSPLAGRRCPDQPPGHGPELAKVPAQQGHGLSSQERLTTMTAHPKRLCTRVPTTALSAVRRGNCGPVTLTKCSRQHPQGALWPHPALKGLCPPSQKCGFEDINAFNRLWTGYRRPFPPSHSPLTGQAHSPRGSAFRRFALPLSPPGTTLNSGFSSLGGDVPAVSHLDCTVTARP